VWKILKRWRWVLPLGAALGLSLLVLKGPQRAKNAAELGTGRLGSVLLEAPARFTRFLRESQQRLRGMMDAQERAEKLEEELALLRLEYRQLEESYERSLKRGNALDFGKRYVNNLIPANLLARDPGTWFKVILLDRGSSDGVKPGAGVVSPQGVVGRVLSAEASSSKVVFLTDSSCRLSVRLARSRVLAILAGDGRNACHLEYLSGQDDVKVDDQVETAPGSLGFPSGIPAGRVTRVEKVDNGLKLDVDVEPAADLNRLESLYVAGSRQTEAP
jgi:rod shape-determining protein MreC